MTVPHRPREEYRGHTACTPPPTGQLFEIVVLDTTGDDGRARWNTVGWGVDRADADAIARTYVTRQLCPYEAVQIRHDGRLLAEHRRSLEEAAHRER
ncbi:hypothetical protein [Nonomuraea sp. B1E8]|uniref:hypothetical protein n=1 Tax=unclassified Nonomuraea TaxID=2593643 RepID=UPI00325CCF5E